MFFLGLLQLGCTPADPVDTSEPVDTQVDSPTDSGEPTPCPACVPSPASLDASLGPAYFSTDANRTKNNPLKGFLTSYLWGAPVSDFPDQMEFLYLPMKQLWDANGETLETGLEPYLVAAAEREHHAVLRVYLDYPTKDSGVPDYLQSVVSCESYTHFGGGCSPDYDNPDLVSAMTGLIEALGARYDGDNRLGFIQVGLLGFWGEWHTWPETDWFPSEETQRAILDAYHNAFQTTQLQVRRAAVHTTDLRIGFHDDSFAYSTIGNVDWFFLPGLETAGADSRWEEVAIGGELRPELQSSVFSEDYIIDTYSQDVGECIDATHASYLLNYYAYNGDQQGYIGSARTKAEAAALQMGYQFEILDTSLSLTDMMEGEVEAEITVRITQRGVAPFYYPLYVQLNSEELGAPVISEKSLHGLLPGKETAIRFSLGRIPVDAATAPFSLELTSPILQDTQQVLLATSTDASAETGPTVVGWDLSCEENSEVFALGAVVREDADGCACRCDVDGTIRTATGEICDP